jgi:ElaB/YqjD/DUF883 family membrane-anchored ribosome-binding protein
MDITEKVSQSAHEAYDKIADASSQAAEALCDKGEKLKKAEQKLMKNCCGYISENPVTSVGIVISAGYLLGRVLNRPGTGSQTS